MQVSHSRGGWQSLRQKSQRKQTCASLSGRCARETGFPYRSDPKCTTLTHHSRTSPFHLAAEGGGLNAIQLPRL